MHGTDQPTKVGSCQIKQEPTEQAQAAEHGQEQGEAGGGGERRMVREPVARNRYTDACTSTYYIVLDTNTYKLLTLFGHITHIWSTRLVNKIAQSAKIHVFR
mgnify:CR=1 FL=1